MKEESEMIHPHRDALRIEFAMRQTVILSDMHDDEKGFALMELDRLENILLGM